MDEQELTEANHSPNTEHNRIRDFGQVCSDGKSDIKKLQQGQCANDLAYRHAGSQQHVVKVIDARFER